MTPRTASVRAAHQKGCANEGKTALDSTGRGSGCTCAPSFYSFHRDRDGRVQKGPRVKSKAEAVKQANRIQVDLDERRAGGQRNIAFDKWSTEYQANIARRVQRGELKPKTLIAYRETLTIARGSLRDTLVREIGPPELRDFHECFDSQSPASQLRHLRQLAACLSAAVDDGYADTNPVKAFMKKLRLRSPKRGKAPFEDDEIERMWEAYKNYESVYLYSARFSVESGARLGEIAALDWQNVDLTNGRVLIEATWDDRAGLVPPKDREPRTVYLTPEAKAVLEAWVKVAGVHTDGPVFPNPLTGGRMTLRIAQRRLVTVMADAKVPKLHPDLRLPRSFHSFRYTTSNVMQRRGYHPRLIEATLGHSSLELTYGVYGGWTPEQLAAEAARSTTGTQRP